MLRRLVSKDVLSLYKQSLALQPNMRAAPAATMQKRITRISGISPLQRQMATTSRPASSSDTNSSREDQKGESSVKELGSDMKTVISDFTNVPRPAMIFGFAGALPCLAASVMSVAYADSPELLAFIEPVQVGYGACILSWLGAIHWGLEMAEYNGSTGYARYSYGVIPPLLAWPTLFFPTDVALLSQSIGYVFLLYTDVKAAGRGWTPKWFPFLRYWLTWIAGGSIWISLIGKDWRRRGRPSKRVKEEFSSSE